MVLDIYSKRKKREKEGLPDIILYDELNKKIRTQILYLFNHLFKKYGVLPRLERARFYRCITRLLREERGEAILSNGRHGHDNKWSYQKEIEQYFLNEENVEYALDVVEVFFKFAEGEIKKSECKGHNTLEYMTIIRNLNTRFSENRVGYRFENNRIIRVNSEIIHQEIISPTLELLHQKEFGNANDEYLKAHDHYKHGDYEDSITNCLKSLETTIRIIGEERGWKIQENATAQTLLNCVFEQNLIPSYLQSHYSGLRGCLGQVIATVRNKAGGHGKGIRTENTKAYIAEYLLGETANAIRLIVTAHYE